MRIEKFYCYRVSDRMGGADSHNSLTSTSCASSEHFAEGGVRVCGDAVLGYFWCGFAVIFILTCGIAVLQH